MDEGAKGPEFRWQEHDQLHDEIIRMDGLLATLSAVPEDGTPGSFRPEQDLSVQFASTASVIPPVFGKSAPGGSIS
jgi:hypothetical protein